MSMKSLLSIVLCFFISGIAISQDTLNISIRDKDISNFQKIKLYMNVVNKKGESLNNLDSSSIFIEEVNSGKKVNPNVEKFFNSDESIALCFLIDASNSMKGEPLNNIKEGLLTILPELRKQDKIGISYFNDEFYKKTDFTNDKEILKNNINDLSTGGSSSQIYPSIKLAVDWLNSNNSSRKIFIILSDGDDNSNLKREEIEALISEKSFSVFTIGTIAENSESKNMLFNLESISSKAKDGFYYRIYEPEDMKNIIPAIYDRVKNEYILTYYSYEPVSTDVKANINIVEGKNIFQKEYSYRSPDKIIENAPSVSFWKTKEFLYGSIGAGVILLGLAILLALNIKKKKQFKLEKEEEQKLRLAEAEENKARFENFQREYDELLDRLENQQNVSQADREKILQLEEILNESSKTAFGEHVKIDTRRRTMILDAKENIPEVIVTNNNPIIIIQSGPFKGQQYQLNKDKILIGRLEGDVIIGDDTISRMHAEITNINGKYFIRDYNSTNGTFINNRRVNQSPLSNGDLIRLGNIQLIFNN